MSGEPELHIEIRICARAARPGFAPLGMAELHKVIPIKGAEHASPDYFATLCADSLKGFADEAEIQELEIIGGDR